MLISQAQSIGKPHKHADVIVAWVMGKSIQGQSPSTDKWVDVPDVNTLEDGDNFLNPSPIHPDYDWWDNWRVKP